MWCRELFYRQHGWQDDGGCELNVLRTEWCKTSEPYLHIFNTELEILSDTDEVCEVEEAAPDFRADISSLLRSELLRTARRNHSVCFYDE